MIGISRKGEERAVTNLERLRDRLDRAPMMSLGQAGVADVHARFDTQGYGTWAPKSVLTDAGDGSGDVLVSSGAMRDSVKIGIVMPGQVTVVVPYGGADQDPSIPIKHQLGEGVPRRPLVEVTEQLLARLDPIIDEWLIQ